MPFALAYEWLAAQEAVTGIYTAKHPSNGSMRSKARSWQGWCHAVIEKNTRERLNTYNSSNISSSSEHSLFLNPWIDTYS